MSVQYVDKMPNWANSETTIPTVLGWENKNTGEILVSLASFGGAANPQPSKYLEIRGIEEQGKEVIPTTISMSQKTMTITEGSNKIITATIAPETASQDVEWYNSSDANVTIVSDGLSCIVTGVLAGKSTVTAKWAEDESILATCVVTVDAKVVHNA